MARKATTSTAARTAKARATGTQRTVKKTDIAKKATKAATRTVSAKASKSAKTASAKGAAGKKKSDVRRTTPSVSPDIVATEHGYANIPELLHSDGSEQPAGPVVTERAAFSCGIDSYEILYPSGSTDTPHALPLKNNSVGGPLLSLKVSRRSAAVQTSVGKAYLHSVHYVFHDAVAGQILTERVGVGNNYAVFVGKPAADLHPIHYMLQTEAGVKCRVYAQVSNGSIEFTSIGLKTSPQQVGQRES